MVLGLDLGSVHLGAVLGSDTLPLVILAADTWAVDAHDLGPIADRVREEIDALTEPGRAPPAIVAELGTLYIPKDATPAAARAMAANHAVMDRLLLLIWQACPGPIYQVSTIARRAWSSRVLPHHAGGISTAESNAALAAHLDPNGGWALLWDQHRRDASGAILGWLIGVAARAARPSRPGKPGRVYKRAPYVPKPTSPRKLARQAEDAAFDALCEQGALRIAAAPPRVVMSLSATTERWIRSRKT